MNELQTLEYNIVSTKELRMIMQDGEPWWIAVDVCAILDIQNSRDALKRLDEDEKGVVLTDTLGGKQEMNIVNEFGLYNLILGSRKPEAKEFKRWVTHEVLPQIRATGEYRADGGRKAPYRIQTQSQGKVCFGAERTARELLSTPLAGVKYMSGRDMVPFFRQYDKTVSLINSPGYANRLIRKRAERLASEGKDVSLYFCQGTATGANNRLFTVYYATKQGCDYMYQMMRATYRDEFRDFYMKWFSEN